MNTNIRAEILNLIAKNRQTIYGQQATNFHLPSNLKRETKDFDVLTKKPETSARELVERLNKKYGNRFEVTNAVHPTTFKVKDKTTGETIVDYTRTTKKPNSYNELGVRYSNLEYSKKKLKNILKNEAYKFRHDKDSEMLKRIKQIQKSWRRNV